MRIYCTPIGVSHVKKELQKKYPSLEFIEQGGILSKYETEKALLNETHAIIGSEKIDEEFLLKSCLKAIARFGGSTENIDTIVAEKLGIKVFSYRSERVISDVANLTINFVLSATFDFIDHNERLKNGRWFRPSYLGNCSKVIVLGSGNIGTLVYKRLLALGFEKLELISIQKIMESQNIFDQLLEIVSGADILILSGSPKCWPKEALMQSIKKSQTPLKIINTARGSLVNEQELYQLLIENKKNQYFTDVFYNEPPEKSSLNLLSLKNVYVTPHIGGYSSAALKEVAFSCVDFLMES